LLVDVGKGYDRIQIADAVRVGGDVQLMGDAPERVFVSGATVGKGLSIDVAGSNSLGSGTSIQVKNSWITRNLTISTGAGDDQIWIEDITVGADATIHAGAGADSIRFFGINTVSGSICVYAEQGKDSVSNLGLLLVSMDALFDGGNGSDLLSGVLDILPHGDLTTEGFETVIL
jgi:hypothetical protein